jgi:Cu/Ag efflux protein CusF
MEPQKHARWLALIVTLGICAGCATAYTPPPLSVAHPAHPEAPTAPALPRSTTLASRRGDMPAAQPAMSHHGGPDTQASSHRDKSLVVGEGKVVAIVPESRQMIIDHQEIPGFMGAMTMGYKVEPPSLLEGLAAEDRIRFTIDTAAQAIVKVEKLTK